MCHCPILNKHCTSGLVDGSVSLCEFWSDQDQDCRVRRCLELLEIWLRKKISE